jgi:hypothetical protein
VFALVIIFIGARFGGLTFNSFVVGPLVNAVIMTTVLVSGIQYGVMVGLLTPVMAALTGQLLPPMVPFMPFIMLGNITLAIVFGLLAKHAGKFGSFIGIVVGAVLKTLVLVLSVKYLITLFGINMAPKVMEKLYAAMSYPQLYTAIAGGIIALLLYAVYKKAYLKSR